ncbi:hypothetical protein MTR67_023160 [Solanum verrucosum]|uniref:Uncharacterized protein n=1 Tax=Solanum verrucosum TaxID=315347 RepID=A0AAF0QZ73_SOLVR|nr:hypothetical protein MTR67_023160 [Solanum verrucosum]
MVPFEALYGRRCRSPIGWFKVGEVALICPELMHEAIEKVRLICDRLKMAQTWQKSFVDVRSREIKLVVDDWVYLQILPMKGVMRFRKKGKLGKVAYDLELPNDLALVHLAVEKSRLSKILDSNLGSTSWLYKPSNVGQEEREAEAALGCCLHCMFSPEFAIVGCSRQAASRLGSRRLLVVPCSCYCFLLEKRKRGERREKRRATGFCRKIEKRKRGGEGEIELTGDWGQPVARMVAAGRRGDNEGRRRGEAATDFWRRR